MSLLPDIVDGKLVEGKNEKIYTPPKIYTREKEEVRLAEINNFGRPKVAEDFSDSPHLNI